MSGTKPLTVYAMPTIYGKSMLRLDRIMTHFSHQQFESGTNSQMIKSTPSLLSFKHKLGKDTSKTPKHYYCGDRISQILHTRLRTGCSVLRYYLYNRNLVPDALCFCGTVENNFHFLLECQRYNVMRREMLQTVSRFTDVSEMVLLYGDSNLSDTNNELVFKAVHRYIHQTKRFSSRN